MEIIKEKIKEFWKKLKDCIDNFIENL